MRCNTTKGTMGHKICENQSKNSKSEDKTLKRPFRCGQDRYTDSHNPHFIFVRVAHSKVSPKHQKYYKRLSYQVADLVFTLLVYVFCINTVSEDSLSQNYLVFLGYTDIFILHNILKQIEYIIIMSIQ